MTFEDQLMDLALYRDGRLVVCCEVKERASQVHELATRIRAYQERIDDRSSPAPWRALASWQL